MSKSSLRVSLQAFTDEFDPILRGYLMENAASVPQILSDAIAYSALAPGKRIRPYLVVRCAEVCGAKREDAWPIAAAIECIHAFSLVHDDLPAMDNDEIRRGQPTTHKKFGEAIAILAGDALLALAFELLARHCADQLRLGEMAGELATATGRRGMIGGQAADILSETSMPELAVTRAIHERKTACLISAACRLGAHVAVAPPTTVDVLGEFGKSLGLAFQIADDLLDSTASAVRLGKSVGKDRPAGKQTYPACVGVEASREAARNASQAAMAALAGFGSEAGDLRELAEYVVVRDY